MKRLFPLSLSFQLKLSGTNQVETNEKNSLRRPNEKQSNPNLSVLIDRKNDQNVNDLNFHSMTKLSGGFATDYDYLRYALTKNLKKKKKKRSETFS